MTPEQEDALVNAYWKFVEEWTGRGKEFHDRYKTTGMEFGLACWKAAYAQGREDAARVCFGECVPADSFDGWQKHNLACADCAAAIRRGE